jgi:flagellar biosynthesis protein FlhA
MSTAPALTGDLSNGRDVGLALGVVLILTVLFLPIPAFLIDMGLAVSVALSVLILMVSLWIARPLDFSSFPMVLLIATMLRLSLNIATTRMILSHGNEGANAAGYIVGGFSRFVMAGDFVIGLVVFAILITVNFVVITKGATRIAEVGARFTLDSIPGKQMSIDADLSAGVIDDAEAQRRRRELEEESAFFGSMDGASKFVRGDAVAGLIITAINIFGGVAIGYFRHNMALADSTDVFVKLAVGDGLVSQIPALVVSLAAGLLVSKGGTKGAAEKAVFSQLSAYPRALFVASSLLVVLGAMPGLPMLPFFSLAAALSSVAYVLPRRQRARDEAARVAAEEDRLTRESQAHDPIKAELDIPGIELVFGKQLGARLMPSRGELAHRMARMRRKFVGRYGFVVPEVRISDDFAVSDKAYVIKINGTLAGRYELRVGEVLVFGDAAALGGLPKTEVTDPAYGIKAFSVPEAFDDDIANRGLAAADNVSVIMTHLSEVIRNNLPQLFTYRDMKALIGRLDHDYRKLADELCSSHLSFPVLQAILKQLLGEGVSIRSLHLIVEAIAEVAPSLRKTDQIVEHVRMRIAPQICAAIAENGVLPVLRLGSRWDLAFHEALKRDANGAVREFDMDPSVLESFGTAVSRAVQAHGDGGRSLALVTAPEARVYVRMIVERLHPSLPVLSHLEIAKGIEVRVLGSIS